jgi:ribonuclease BN (tRNA processing enzyme)
MMVTFLGTGDAFGSGGRLQTCILVDAGAARFLIDCGATALSAMKRHDVDPSSIGTVLVSHLHGDHFGGLPFLILDGHFSKRRDPLRIAGPPGVEARVRATLETFFPQASAIPFRFDVEFLELSAGRPARVGPLLVSAAEVVHPSGAPPYALRVEAAGATIAYSGDTEWTDALATIADGADLFVCEAYTFDSKVKYHLDYATIAARRDRLRCRRLVLTHMGPDMLSRLGGIDAEAAFDGMRITV